jgi:hypothetical protein
LVSERSIFARGRVRYWHARYNALSTAIQTRKREKNSLHH